jgi:hypothetical protein
MYKGREEEVGVSNYWMTKEKRRYWTLITLSGEFNLEEVVDPSWYRIWSV